MSQKLDAIIFGATGFSGQIAVRDAVELLKDYKWGIAGRNKSKLEMVLREVGSKINKDLSNIPIVVADITDSDSIKEMAQKCKVVLNCCGPYTLYGEVVVKSCIQAGTHHVDISGEPQYIDGMQLKYHELAKEKNCYIISTCGFDSIPSEMGVVHAEKNFDGTINSVEMYLENSFDRVDRNSQAFLHSGTWESAIRAIRDFKKVLTMKMVMNDQIKCTEVTPKVYMKPYIQKPNFADSYFLPMPLGDRDIVERSQKRLCELEHKRPIQFEAYVGFRSLFWAIFLPLYFPILILLTFIPYTFKLLLKYPEIFTFGRVTHQGPTASNQEGHTFRMTFKSTGWARGQPFTSNPSKVQLTRVSGRSPFYGLTGVSLILSAKTILNESDKMPGSGGVLSPAAAFYKTNIIKELEKHKYGMKFEILK